MPKYFLMNKNEKSLEFETIEALGGTKVVEKQSFSSRRPIGFVDIGTWIQGRNYAKHKEHFNFWLKEWSLDTIDGFLGITHALSMNDSLWVKPTDSILTWEEVNLYHNDFTDVAARTAFETGLYGLQLTSTSPEFTMEGSFPKCWIKEDDGIYLYKAGLTGASNVGLEPYSEYMSSAISKQISESIIPYELTKFKGQICSKCKLFTDENTGFVPMYKLINRNKSYSLGDILDICENLGYKNEFLEMLLIDSIIFNQDRHLGNFGFLVDNNTFTIKGFAPLFDFNISMLCNALDEDLKDFDKYEEEYRVGHKLGGRFSDVGKDVLTRLQRTLPESLTIPIHPLYNLPNERIKLLIPIFESNYDKIRGKNKLFFVQPENERSSETNADRDDY